ncbi:MAG: segregation/condensation protein A [Candidatus Falkowbacteria bacterium]|nr:segregation/condensation protein A [Candidatus Falkowbacteria bacterium]
MLDFKLEQFEGPLALLVKLIDKAELDITQLSLATVADQYIAYLRTMTDLDPEEMADFLVVASRLLLIKSKALLPYLLPEEEQAIDEFEHQLRMYKEFLEASKGIEKMVAGKKFMFVREFNRKAMIANLQIFAPPSNLDGAIMFSIMSEVLKRVEEVIVEPLEEATLVAKINIEDKIKFIESTIFGKIRSRFSELISKATSKVEVIVSFLAMLELMKQRSISADQSELFAEIDIFRLELEKEI